MRLLIVGGLSGQIGLATRIAMDRGAKVTHAGSIDQALATLRGGADLVFCDVGLEIGALVRGLAAERICTPVVACGVGTDTRRAVDEIRAGAKECLPLPADSELIAAVLAAVADESHQLVHEDEAMNAVLGLADQIAGSEASILITGESGTGKEVMARYIHRKSHRADKPFISVNCAAIPENLLESELFGHEKGAFTGAIARRIGKFEEANGGTLLLDEISEMDARLQAKLLRAIQEREIDRVGGTRPVKVDIRIIATSNRDLAEAVRHGTFREDLLYRLNVVNLRLPALRERPKDIRALSQHFARKYAEANGVPFRVLAPQTERLLLGHPWRGNVRELENTIHRAVLLAQGTEIGPEAIRLPDGTQVGAQPATPGSPVIPSQNVQVQGAMVQAGAATRSLVGRTVSDVERDLILDTLDHCLGNRTHAANILGISIRTLRNKLREYSDSGLSVPSHGEQRMAG